MSTYLPFREELTMLTDEAAAQRAASKISPKNTYRLQTVLKDGICYQSAMPGSLKVLRHPISTTLKGA
jgi:hypothetical protein